MKNKILPRSLPSFRAATIKLEITMAKKPYSEPKLYKAKKNGKVSVDKGCYWYVYFYTRDQFGDLKYKHNFSRGINRLKTIKERTIAGNSLRNALVIALERGWLPGEKPFEAPKRAKNTTPLSQALERAYEIKRRSLKPSTLKGYEFYKNVFIEYLVKNNLDLIPVCDYTIDHFYVWLDHIRFEYLKEDGNPLSGTSINNARRSLSALFTVLKNERYIDFNFIKEIPPVDEDPVNNEPFSQDQLTAIKKYLEKNDPYLLEYTYFIVYSLLRLSEICRLTIGDINLEKKFLQVESKTESVLIRKLSPQLIAFLQSQKIERLPQNYHLFSNKNKPKDWSNSSLKGRVDHFGVRFRVVKKHLGLGRNHGLYSFRHTAITNLYEALQKQGLNERQIIHELMPITGHKSEAGIRAYLRRILRSIPKDHNNLYTLDY